MGKASNNKMKMTELGLLPEDWEIGASYAIGIGSALVIAFSQAVGAPWLSAC